MDDDWQKLADEEVPPAPKPLPAAVNKWEGEDEDDDIKDSWDADDDDEKKDEEKTAQPTKPKKQLAQKIAERKQQELEQEERRRKEKEEEDMANLSPAEKLRLKKLQEEADTLAALDTLGLNSSSSSSGIDSFNPKTEEQFKEFADAISRKVAQHQTKKEFQPFMEDLVNKLCAGLSAVNIRKIEGNLKKLAAERQKIERDEKTKKKPTGKAKETIFVERDDDYNSRVGAYEADDYDDFM